MLENNVNNIYGQYLTKTQLNSVSSKKKKSFANFLIAINDHNSSKLFFQSNKNIAKKIKYSVSTVQECKVLAAILGILVEAGTTQAGVVKYNIDVERLHEVIKDLTGIPADKLLKKRRLSVEASSIVKLLNSKTAKELKLKRREIRILKEILFSVNKLGINRASPKTLSQKTGYSVSYVKDILRELNQKSLLVTTYNLETQDTKHQVLFTNIINFIQCSDFLALPTEKLDGGCRKTGPLYNTYNYLHNYNVKKNVEIENNDKINNLPVIPQTANIVIETETTQNNAEVVQGIKFAQEGMEDVNPALIAGNAQKPSESIKNDVKSDLFEVGKLFKFGEGEARVTLGGKVVGDYFASSKQLELAIARVIGYHRRKNKFQGSSKNKTDKQLAIEINAHIKANNDKFSDGRLINSAIKLMCAGLWQTPSSMYNKTIELSKQAEEMQAASKSRDTYIVSQQEYVRPSVEDIYKQADIGLDDFENYHKINKMQSVNDLMQLMKASADGDGDNDAVSNNIVPPTPNNTPASTPTNTPPTGEQYPRRPDTPLPQVDKPETFLPTEVPFVIEKPKLKFASEATTAEESKPVSEATNSIDAVASMIDTYYRFIKIAGISGARRMVETSAKFDEGLFDKAVTMYLTC